MKFHFDANLDYQLNAIDAVVRLFEGASTPGLQTGLVLTMQNGVVGNTLPLTDAALLANLHAVQVKLDDTQCTDGRGQCVDCDFVAHDDLAVAIGSAQPRL